MLQAPVQPLNYSLRERKKPSRNLDLFEEEEDDAPKDKKRRSSMTDVYNGADADGGGKGKSKSRRELPQGAVATLKAWLLSPEHFSHPYPTPQDQAMLMQKTGIDKKQLKNWFTNARRRIWKPMLKKQIESGQLTATGPAGVPGAVPGLMLSALPGAVPNQAMDGNPHSVQAIRVHYQQATGGKHQPEQPPEQQHAVPLDPYGNPVYSGNTDPNQFFAAQPSADTQTQPQLSSVSSLGTLPRQSSNTQLSKTDSHAVLMELFARDQDLVRQATESARLKAEAKQQPAPAGQPAPQSTTPSQHPMRAPSAQTGVAAAPGGTSGTLQNVPTMNSWPHFSSITSLNNLGTIPGVKSITSLSGADLASKGNVNRKGNLAQVKSIESMGKNDSYAFLEVFFGDKSTNSSANLNAFGGSSSSLKGGKGTGEEDNEIGLSLEDESPAQPMKEDFPTPAPVSASPQPAPLTNMAHDSSSSGTPMESGTLKRAYDDALAARGLISVSRSSEKLTDLVLPAKMQRTLSQEFINKDQMQQQQQQSVGMGQYSYTPAAAAPASTTAPSQASSQQQYPGQQPVEPEGSKQSSSLFGQTNSSQTGDHVQVPSSTKCALCSQVNVDTQLRPCGHMFHERCLKPSLQTPRGPPKCPVDNVPMHSAVLAVPTEETPSQSQQTGWNFSSLQSMPSAAENKGT